MNYLVEKGLFMTIYDNLFGFTYNKEEKEKKLKAFVRIESCPLIATVTSEGRKFVGA